MAKTKIIATLGPASSNAPTLKGMILAGMDVARLNFSHGTAAQMLHRIKLVGRRVKLLGDLQGHRIRIGALAAPIELSRNRIVWLTQKKVAGSRDRVPLDYAGDLSDIKNGQSIFIDDGNIFLKVIGRGNGSLKTKVIVGGLLKERKGVNLPDAQLEFGPINRKDIDDILFCQKNGVEYIAQSFVRTRKDILEVKEVLGTRRHCRIIAKIESREGIENIDEIIKVSDGIMVARGDMGVSLPIYEIPIIQKMIIKKCNRAGKFVITATQMLESMTSSLRPTRAEVTDVANAILDGTDFVMLSAESAVGAYPSETVAMMNSIIKFTESYARGGSNHGLS